MPPTKDRASESVRKRGRKRRDGVINEREEEILPRRVSAPTVGVPNVATDGVKALRRFFPDGERGTGEAEQRKRAEKPSGERAESAAEQRMVVVSLDRANARENRQK